MKKYKITEEQFENVFDYEDEDYTPGFALLNFYSILVYDIMEVEDFDKIDGKYIEISNELYDEIFSRIKEDAKKAGYPSYPTENIKISIKQGMYQWTNSGPSSSDNLDKYKILVKQDAIK